MSLPGSGQYRPEDHLIHHGRKIGWAVGSEQDRSQVLIDEKVAGVGPTGVASQPGGNQFRQVCSQFAQALLQQSASGPSDRDLGCPRAVEAVIDPEEIGGIDKIAITVGQDRPSQLRITDPQPVSLLPHVASAPEIRLKPVKRLARVS